MDRGSSDEAIVGVKLVAEEDAVTYPREKTTGKRQGGWSRRVEHVAW